MKKFFYIFSTIVALGVLASCVKETPYEPGPKDLEGCYGVFFPTQDASGSHIYDPTMEKVVTITVGRENTDDNITVPVVVTSDTPDMFVVDDVTFAAGQAEATFDVSFPNIETAKEYSFTISVQDPKYASLYKAKAASLDFSVLCVEWKKFAGKDAAADAQGHIYENNASAYLKTPLDFDAELWYHDTAYEGIRYCEIRGAFQLAEANYVFYWNTKTDVLYVPQQFIGIIDEESLYVGAACDFYNAYQGWGEVCPSDEYFEWAPAWLKKNNFFQPYYDKNGGFYLGDWLYICEGDVATEYGYQFGGDEKTCDLYLAPGFTRVDYSIEAETDYSYDGEVPVYFTTGADVAEIKYFVADAELTATQAGRIVDAIIAGTQEGVQSISGDDIEFDEEEGLGYSGLSLSFEESGFYTLVAVTVDAKGEFHESTTVTLNYVAGDDDDFEVDINCATEPTPARYASAGLNEYNSYAYSVWGSDLTDVKVGLYTLATVQKYGFDAIVSDLRYEDEETNSSVSEEVLAQINGVGGYASAFAKLDAGTDYVLFVWATNGRKAECVYSQFATEASPETWHSLGIGQYTDDCLGPLFGASPLSYEIEIQESDETAGRYKLIYPYGEAFPLNEPGDYDTSKSYDIIVMATDPDHVYIPQQDTGCNWGYGMMSIVSDAARYIAAGYPISVIEANGIAFGTLKDGVITMPKGGMIVFDNDGGYKMNTNGEFKIVLPSAYKKSAALTQSPVNVSYDMSSRAKPDFRASKQCGVKSSISFERTPGAAKYSVSSAEPKIGVNAASGKGEIKKYTPIAM